VRFVPASFLAALVAALIAAFAPLGTRCSASSTGVPESCSSVSSYEVDGSYILVVVAVPVVIAFLPVLVRHRSAVVVSATLLWVCCVLGIASIGMILIPSAVLMTIAAVHRDPAVVPQG
jgi:hypothetical protein